MTLRHQETHNHIRMCHWKSKRKRSITQRAMLTTEATLHKKALSKFNVHLQIGLFVAGLSGINWYELLLKNAFKDTLCSLKCHGHLIQDATYLQPITIGKVLICGSHSVDGLKRWEVLWEFYGSWKTRSASVRKSSASHVHDLFTHWNRTTRICLSARNSSLLKTEKQGSSQSHIVLSRSSLEL